MDISATPQVVSRETLDMERVALDVQVGTSDFTAFYQGTTGRVTRALALTLGDVDLAADATNEGMTRAYQRWSKVSTYNNPAGWVYRVGLNWSLSWKQRRRRDMERPVHLVDETVEPVFRDDSMDRALAKLSVERRAVVVCRIHLDWSVAQTAEALDIAPGTVKSRLARALAELKQSIEISEGVTS